MQIQLAHSEGDFFRDMRYVQVPGIDSIWHQIWTDTVSDFPRFASSAAHVYGHPRSFTESFAAYRPEPDITMARYILNEQFVRGVNLVETMYFPASTTPAREGGPPHGGPSAVMQDPGFPALTRYTSRLSYLMSQGHPAAEVALLLPAESLWMSDTRADDTFVSTERVLSEHQVDFDIVDEDAIGSLLKAAPGVFLSESGNRYRTVLVPHADLLPAAVVARLHAFANGGGRVVFLGALPTYVAGRDDLNAHKAAVADFAWASVAEGELPATPTPPAQPPASAPGPLVIPATWLATVQKALPQSALTLGTPNPEIRFMHRSLKDGTVYLLFNESSTTVDDQLTLHGNGATLELWDPQTGTSTAAVGVKPAGHGAVSLPLHLAPYATQVLVLH
jgi:hypothetical protein